ncbi:phosphatidylinositol mannoside acyltransferase [Rugosimonospora acidiphila]|uniref:Phosphatidylinositol mannoside acyltransferase n=1 Tax=Rugosimonospora acidiphila TaxID=556531 RepID=A0ABP9RYY6_9ACTN
MSRTADLAYAAGWRVLRMLPLAVTAPAFDVAADFVKRRGGTGVTRLAGNLRRVVGPELPGPEFDALVRRAMRSYFRYALEGFRLPSLSRDQHLRGFVVDGLDELAASVDAGRGVIVALPHAGNWDAAGAWVAARGWKMITVQERLKPESLYRRFVAFRESLGMEILPLTGGEGSIRETLETRLRRGYVVPILADRDLPGKGVEVTFFGARTTVPPGPALLAMRTGAPLYTLDMWYEKDAAHARLRGPLPVPGPETGNFGARVRALTQSVADGLAKGIAAHPADWHMMQRMWPDDAVVDEKAAATNDEAGR